MDDEAIKTAEIKTKLLVPTGQRQTDAFRALLASRLKDEVVPIGVVMCFTLMCSDIEKNRDGFTGKPIGGALVGLPGAVLNMLALASLTLFPPEFAAKVRAEWKAAVG
jgi:hypothetical protein